MELKQVNWILRIMRVVVMMSITFISTLALAQQKTVYVFGVQGVTANAEIREGLREGLKWGGFFEGKVFKLQYDEVPASGLKDAITRATVSKPDAIVAIAPSAIQAAVSATRHYPVVYINVLDPVDAVALKPEDMTGTNVTGISNMAPVARQVAIIKQLVPQARKVGVLYNPGDPVSVARIKELQEQMAKNGLAMLDAAAHRPSDVGAAARSLINRVDAFFSFDDVNVSKSYPALVKVANDAKLPLIASSVTAVRQGAVAAVVVTNRDLGVQAGKMLTRVLRGSSPSSIQPEVARPMLMLNQAAAQKQGLTLTEQIQKSAGEIIR